MKRSLVFFLTLVTLLSNAQDIPDSEGKALTFSKNMPYFEDCKSTDLLERDKCTRLKIGNYIIEKFEYPEAARDKNIGGTVYIQFIVNKVGKVTNVKVIRGVHPLLDQASIAAVKKLPSFKPGFHNGKPVAIIYTIPVRIQIDSNPRDNRKAKRESKKRDKKSPT